MLEQTSLDGATGTSGRATISEGAQGKRRAVGAERSGVTVKSGVLERSEQEAQPGRPVSSAAVDQSIERALAEVQHVMAMPASAIQTQGPEEQEAALRQVHILLRRLQAHSHS